MRILTIDSNESSRDAALRILGRNGYQAESVDATANAVDLLKQENPGEPFKLVIVNLGMPDSTAEQRVDEIRRALNISHPDVKLIGLLSPEANQESPEIRKVSLDSLVQEPFNEIDLIKAVKLLTIQGKGTHEFANEQSDNPNARVVLWDPTEVIEELGGKKSTFLIMLRYFTDQLMYRLIDMERSIQTASPRSLKVAAHTIKIGAKQFKQTDLVEVATRLEAGAEKSDWELIEEVFPEFQEVCLDKVRMFGSYLASESLKQDIS